MYIYNAFDDPTESLQEGKREILAAGFTTDVPGRK